MSILNLLYSTILKIIADVMILREVFELILTRGTYAYMNFYVNCQVLDQRS